MGYCKDCSRWDKYENTCSVDWKDRDSKVQDDDFFIYAHASDDQGLDAGLKTGPLFGCIQFLCK